jgi:ATPase subunit of ABC transporter with duplicated ATPase domains
MNALESWNGGVIVISHDERFINTIAKEVSTVYLPDTALIGYLSSGCVQMERSTSTREMCHRTRYDPTLQNKGLLT